jgi:hypothetical protein
MCLFKVWVALPPMQCVSKAKLIRSSRKFVKPLNFIPKDRYFKIAPVPNASRATKDWASSASSLAMK